MTHPPLAVLKLPMLMLLVAALLAVGGILWSQGKATDAEGILQQQHAAFNAAQKKFDRSREQQQLIATHLADYQALAARGFVAAEDRLAWIEAAQLASREVGLGGLAYRLAPRTASDSALAKGLPLGQTAMFLTMPLLVETDLTRFLAALKARAPGIYRVQGCRMSRASAASPGAADSTELQADCELLWFTVAQPQGNPA